MRLALCVVAIPVLLAQPGPAGRPKIDATAADEGRRLYLQHCINCHGTLGQGTDEGPDLVRSVAVLRDRAGSELGPALTRLRAHKADFTQPELSGLSNFLKQRVEYTAQNRNAAKPPNVLTGNVSAGLAYFNGEGKCSGCHSSTGDLSDVGRRYDSITLQQRFLFPRAKPVRVTVTMPEGDRITGTLDLIDDFSVSLRDAAGELRAFTRGAGVDVTLEDRLTAHHELLDRISDAQLHNTVTYLETLK